ncbi:phage holin family protein [Ruficoccus amylovorans]|uniref:Phage holin family protein n=1 Tax=Ruficoccus amylovorans TaxID=1804625 RepID=A0A842HGH9_9BACT|nr:phage holin family protein [Ruficoccus amylovorans]MBC2595128.1 phage holin family protein [Ruficoccus amylovorans]
MKSLQSVGALAETLLHMLETRFELFALEFRLERARFATVLMLVVIGSGSLLLAGVAFTAGLIWAVPPDYRLLALGLCMLAYLAAAGACAFFLTRIFQKTELPFHETRQELKQDVQCLVSAARSKE